MALPQSLSGVEFPLQNYNTGPFRDSNGNNYGVFRDTVDTSLVEVWKSDNGDTAWAEVDGASRPNLPNIAQIIWAVKDGTRIKIITQDSAENVEYHEFGMSDDPTSADQWVTTNESVDTAPSTTVAVDAALGVRSDGDKVAMYQGARDNIVGTNYERVDYNIHQGTAWGDVFASVDDGGTIHYIGSIIVKGASDKMHLFYRDYTNNTIEHKSLDSSNSLSAAETVNDTTPKSSVPIIMTPGVYYDAGGTERITIGWEDNSGSSVYTSEIDNDGTPGAEEQASGVAVQTVAHYLAVDPNTDTVYLVYSDSSTNDLWLDSNVNSGGWGTDTEILDAVTVTRISANIYQNDSGDTVLAYVYLDGGTVKYNEYVLVAGASQITPTGIASAEAFGTAQLNLTISPSGLASLEAFGTTLLATPVSPTGIASLEAFGTAQIDLILAPSGLVSLEAFGTTQVSGGAQIIPSGIASMEAFGTSQINLTVSPTGIVSLEAFGTALVDLILSPTGIVSVETFGTALISLGTVSVLPAGIISGEAFGTSQINLILSPTGLASGETFGTALVSVGILALRPSGIASGESFGFTNVNIIFLALLYSINGGTPISGVFADWERVALRRNPDGTTAYSPWAVNTWQLSQMLMAEFAELRAQQGAALASLETNDINSRNTAATYTTVILESVVNGGHEGIKALNVNIRFRVKVT